MFRAHSEVITGSRTIVRTWSGVMSLAGALVACVGVNFAQGQERDNTGAEMCWSKPSLRATLPVTPNEEKVAPRIPRAFQSVPRDELQPIEHAKFKGGVVRRVELPADLKLVALTFDLCEQPHEVAGYQGSIVDYLRDNNIRATFFVGGKWMLSHELRAQQLMTDPLFEIGNHTWEHRNLRILTGDPKKKAVLDNEIKGGQRAYERLRAKLLSRQCVLPTGELPANVAPPRLELFRFPFGACNKEAIDAVNDAGLSAIQWDVSSGDPWIGLMPERMVRDVLGRVRPGSIVLFHANGRGWHTPAALPGIIKGLKDLDYKFVTVGELLKAGKPIVTSSCYDFRSGDTERYDSLAKTLETTYEQAKLEVMGSEELPANAIPALASQAALPGAQKVLRPDPKAAQRRLTIRKDVSVPTTWPHFAQPTIVPPKPKPVERRQSGADRSTQRPTPAIAEEVPQWAKELVRPEFSDAPRPPAPATPIAPRDIVGADSTW
jgi:peptidoglycan/xylan/chitin deacetylase (PgdA/CDA1 family)